MRILCFKQLFVETNKVVLIFLQTVPKAILLTDTQQTSIGNNFLLLSGLLVESIIVHCSRGRYMCSKL